MRTSYQLISTYDFDPIVAGSGEPFQFRLEIFRKATGGEFRARVYRLETYRLQPTFPQQDQQLPEWKNDALIFVIDETFDTDIFSGNCANDVLDRFNKALDDTFGPSVPAKVAPPST